MNEHRGTIALLAAANLAFLAVVVILTLAPPRLFGLSRTAWAVAAAVGGIVATLATVWSRWSRVERRFDALTSALLAFRDHDFSMRIVEGADDLAQLVAGYNEAAAALEIDRRDLFQKELLLDTILQESPMAIVLLNPAMRVVFSNGAARSLVGSGTRLEGRRLDQITTTLDASVREALESSQSGALIAIRSGDRDETYRFVRREFFLNTQRHTLLMFERLTPELRRQELEVWKRVIRTMNHELNNSIAPLSSLFHSARHAADRAEHEHRLHEIYETIEERLAHLRDFLEAYARFARLPAPQKRTVEWRSVLDDVSRLYRFRLTAENVGDGCFDRAQIEHVLINLVKNAHESGSAPEHVEVSVTQSGGETVLRVLDRGPGMNDMVMRQALLPFFSTKTDGTGIGLALANEIVEAHGGRLSLQHRDGGGIAVSVVLPGDR